MVTGAGSRVHGREVASILGERGYRRLYLQTGPGILETTLRDRVLSRFYVTLSHRMVGGEHFATILRGGLLGAAGALRLRSLYLDQFEQGEGDQPPLEGQFQAGLLLAEDRRLELFADASVGHGSMPASGADKGVLRGPSPRMI